MSSSNPLQPDARAALLNYVYKHGAVSVPIEAVGGHRTYQIRDDRLEAFIAAHYKTEKAEAVRKALDEGQLIGAAKILDSLWDNSYYALGKAASERIEQEMVYYFGDDWTTYMYDFMTKDGESIPGRHPVPIKTRAQLTKPAPTNKERKL